MNHILVPTDFSQAADNAMEYAALLATELGAAITLSYIHSLPMDPMRIGEITNELYAEGEATINRCADTLAARGLVVYTDVQLGFPIERLKPLIFRERIDLVVMGCQGEHYLPDKIFGSTTTGLMEEVTVPIIAVPSSFTPAFPQNPLLATDHRPVASAETLYPLFELTDRADCKLRVFHYQNEDHPVPEARFRELLADVPYDFFTQMNDGASVDLAIREFIRTTGADLVTLIHRQSTWLSRMIVPSYTRRTVYASPVPVLILQETKSL